MRHGVFWLALVMLFIAVVPAVDAASHDVYDVITNNEIFNAYRPNNQGSCLVTGSTTPNNIPFSNLAWATDRQACDLAGRATPYRGSSTVNIASGSSFTTDRAELVSFSAEERNGRRTTPYGIRINATKYNQVPQSTFIMQDLVWCGESFRGWFNATTLTPTTGNLEADNYPDCRQFWVRSTNPLRQGTSDSRADDAFYNTVKSVNLPFTFPIPVQCSGYEVEIYDRSENTWGLERRAMTFDGIAAGMRQFSYIQNRYTNTDIHNENNILVNVYEKDNEPVAIFHSINHGAPGGGGVGIRVYCINPVDPDTSKPLCALPWKWSDQVNSSPFNSPRSACCGDDGNADLKEVAGYACTQTGTTWNWISPSAQCISGNCCVGKDNESRVLAVQGVQRMCMNVSNTWVWNKAETATAAFTIFPNQPTNFSVISNGTEWLVCSGLNSTGTKPVQGATIQGAAPTATTPTNQQGISNNACGAARICDDYCYDTTECSNPSSPECIACLNQVDVCMQNRNDCSAVGTGLSCQNDACMCAAGTVWNGAQCAAPECPATYTYSASSGLCEPASQGSSSSETVNLQVISVCSVRYNTKQLQTNQVTPQKEHICLEEWKPYAPALTYGLVKNQEVFSEAPNIIFSQYVCKNGEPQPTIPAISQDRSFQGSCGENQCLLTYDGYEKILEPVRPPGTLQRGACVADKQWILNYYCDNGTWTTRTQRLADTLLGLEGVDTTDYVLFCDTYNDTLNAPSDVRGFATNRPPLVNSFCTISRPGDPRNRIIAIGATLNGVGISWKNNEGANDDSLFAPRALASGVFGGNFTSIINDSRLGTASVQGGNGLCANIRSLSATDKAIDAFIECDGVDAGQVFYNPATSTLILTTDAAVAVPQTNYNTFNSLLDTSIPSPRVGLKLYAIQSNGKSVAGIVQYQGPPGNAVKTASIVYNGIDVTSHFNARRGRQTTWSLTGSADKLITMEFRTTSALNLLQQQWEYFTLAIRP